MKHNKSYKKSKNVSNHSARRGKQRAGLSKTETKMMAARAFANGIDSNWTHGELYNQLSCHYGNIKLYANHIYVFGAGGTLITVMNIDPIYEKELYKYVNYPTFVWYKTNRWKHKQNNRDVSDEINVAKQLITAEMNEFLRPAGYKVIDIATKQRSGSVYIDSFKFNELDPEFKKAFKEKFNMSLDKYIEPPKPKNAKDGINFSIIHREDDDRKWELVRKWFKDRIDLTIKFDYFDRNYMIIRPTTQHTKEEIDPEVVHLFEKNFKFKIFVREKNDGCGDNVLFPNKVEIATSVLQWFSTMSNVHITVDEVFDEAIVITTDSPYPSIKIDIAKEIKDAFFETFNRILIVNNSIVKE